MKIVLDTNILLDIVEKREPYFSDSYQIFIKSAERKIEAIISASSVTDIYYVTRKNCKSAEQAIGFIRRDGLIPRGLPRLKEIKT